MPIDEVKIIDLDAHLVGDVPNWESCIDEDWRPYLPRELPARPHERGRTLIGNRILVGDPRRFDNDRPNWMTPEDLTPQGRVRNLDKDGIDIAVLSPDSPALSNIWFAEDPQLAAAYCRAQNNYMKSYANEIPDRLQWAGVIPFHDRDEALKELHRAYDMGTKAINTKAVPVLGREWWDSYYDPIYQELAQLGLPIIFHDTRTGSIGHDWFSDNFFFSHMVGRVLESMVAVMAFVCGGILERHPGLRVVVLESGASHMPWWLGRMDEHYEHLGNLVPWLTMKPSDYFRRQVFVGCEPFEDPLFEWAVETLGDENLVLATDQPHWDSSKPGMAIRPLLESSRLPSESVRKVLGGNAAALLKL
jgi:uncharacterized protein